MATYLIAALVTLAFTIVLTVAGLGAAFILVPVYLALGVSMHSAQATALLLNAIAMAFACARFIPAKLVDFRIAVPIVIVATVLSPLGAYTSSFMPVTTLKWLFVGFLVFAAMMMLFYKPKPRPAMAPAQVAGVGMGVGGAAGFLGGMLGVGGGNFVVPALVWLGLDAKRAAGTTAFVVVFASFTGFLGQASIAKIDGGLLAWTAVASIVGALIGSWLMHRKLQAAQVKTSIGVLLIFIAATMAYKLLA
jgi:Predicted permeases